MSSRYCPHPLSLFFFPSAGDSPLHSVGKPVLMVLQQSEAAPGHDPPWEMIPDFLSCSQTVCGSYLYTSTSI